MSDLKPCPFCGPQDKEFKPSLYATMDVTLDYTTGHFVRCELCGIEMHDEYEADVVERWNTRPPVKEVETV